MQSQAMRRLIVALQNNAINNLCSVKTPKQDRCVKIITFNIKSHVNKILIK